MSKKATDAAAQEAVAVNLPRASWAPVASLKASRNARTHSAAQVAVLADAIVEFGWTNPIVVDRLGAKRPAVLAGHGRLAAAKLLGLSRVPVIGADHLSPAQRRAYILADNRLAELAGWDPELLAIELEGLRGMSNGPDLLAVSGFDPDAVDAVLKRAVARQRGQDPDAVPPVADVIVSEPGDVWVLDGRHRVACGDSTDPAAVEALLDGGRPALSVTDPPYGVNYDPSWRPGAKRNVAVRNDDRVDWAAAWSLSPAAAIYCWAAGGDLSLGSGRALETAGYRVVDQIVWSKRHFPIGRGHYTYRHEVCWYGVRPNESARWFAGDAGRPSVLDVALDPSVEGGHSTQKPVALFEALIEAHEGVGVYEPFLGSGTGLIAAEQAGRRCWAMELAPAFVDVSVRRWCEYSGASAVLESSGVAFEARAAAAATTGRRSKRRAATGA